MNADKMLADEYYCEILHPTINSYCVYPTMVTQSEDYSDILKTNLDRNQKIMNFDRLVEMKNPNPLVFPEIYCINLKDRDDRYDHMMEQFMKYNLKVNFYRPKRNENGAVGCRESHLAVLKEARDRGLLSVLIFEDVVAIEIRSGECLSGFFVFVYARSFVSRAFVFVDFFYTSGLLQCNKN